MTTVLCFEHDAAIIATNTIERINNLLVTFIFGGLMIHFRTIDHRTVYTPKTTAFFFQKTSNHREYLTIFNLKHVF